MNSLRLPIPQGSGSSAAALHGFVRELSIHADVSTDGPEPTVPGTFDGSMRVAALLLRDLHNQGWRFVVGGDGFIEATPPEAATDRHDEKERIRRQELLKRDEQLATPSVRKFIRRMEKPVAFDARPASVLSLVRDGAELAEDLSRHAARNGGLDDFRSIVNPYVQHVASGERCSVTGLLLTDIWRYFRYTWSNQYNTVPGRSMMMLVRDAAKPNHPVIGLASLSSAVMQLESRDRWIGWDAALFVDAATTEPTTQVAQWIRRRLAQGKAEVYAEDLIAAGVVGAAELHEPTNDTIARLRRDGATAKEAHYRFSRARDHKGASDDWELRALTNLFRSKRAFLLADLLQAQIVLMPFIGQRASAGNLARALSDPDARRAVQWVVRRAKSERAGTVIADLTVCGSLAPYAPLAAGKLVALLAVGPEAVSHYRMRYGAVASEIASSIAGRPIVRDARLAFVGTTSLYGRAASQYNRLRMPATVVGGDHGEIRYLPLGLSKSYGTSHLSQETVESLGLLAGRSRRGARVNSIFGEGVNPKMRKVRLGLDALGWSADSLLRHGRQRLVYGVPLVENLRDFALGIDAQPRYLFDDAFRASSEAIMAWWYERWAKNRLSQPSVIAQIADHSLGVSTGHAARVVLPDAPEEMFGEHWA